MKPKIFIGSAVEGLDIAEAIQLGLGHEAWAIVWHQAFPLSSNTIDTLLENSANNDFAVFVFSPVDLVEMRSKTYEIARDNVLFEAGLFMGMHGKGRVFIVVPRGLPSFHVPTDLLGFTTATYDSNFAKTSINAALGPVVTQIKQAIAASNWSRRRLDIQSRATFKHDANWPLKLNLRITNDQAFPVMIESDRFEFGPSAPRAPNARLHHRDIFTPEFRVGQKAGQDLYEPQCVLQARGVIEAWVPLDPAMGLKELESLAGSRQTGVWRFRCVWLDTVPSAQTYEEPL
jgi:hypothetical protein